MLPLILSPQPILRQVAKPVNLPLAQVDVALANQMFAAMEHYHGIGLAAPQINQNLRLFVIATVGQPTAYFNPKIIKTSWKKIDIEEGCLSIPGVFGIVRRPKRILARYYAVGGIQKEEWLTDMVARIYQHEFDHINGVLFTDKTSNITSGRELFAQYGLE